MCIYNIVSNYFLWYFKSFSLSFNAFSNSVVCIVHIFRFLNIEKFFNYYFFFGCLTSFNIILVKISFENIEYKYYSSSSILLYYIIQCYSINNKYYTWNVILLIKQFNKKLKIQINKIITLFKNCKKEHNSSF